MLSWKPYTLWGFFVDYKNQISYNYKHTSFNIAQLTSVGYVFYMVPMASDISFIIQAIDKFSAVAKKIKSSMQGMDRAALKNAGSFKGISQAMKGASASTAVNSAAMSKVAATTAAATAATTAATVATAKVTAATLASRTATKAATEKFDKASRSMRKAAASGSNLSRKMTKVSKSMREAGRAATLKLTAPIALVGIGALVASAKIESMEISFESLTGSAAKAKQVVKSLTDFAAKTPFQLEGIGRASTQLLAAGVTTDELNNRLKLLGDIASVTKVPLTDMSSIFAKIKNKGKAMTEEILQLSDRGIPVIAELTKELKLPKEAIFKLAEKGKIKFDLIVRVLKRMTKKGGIAFNAMEKQSQSLSGVFYTLKDNVFLASATFGDAIVKVTNLKENMKKLTDKIAEIAEKFKKLDPKIQKIIITIGVLAALAGPAILLVTLAAIGVVITAMAITVIGLADAFILTFNAALKLTQLLGFNKEVQAIELASTKLKNLLDLLDKPKKLQIDLTPIKKEIALKAFGISPLELGVSLPPLLQSLPELKNLPAANQTLQALIPKPALPPEVAAPRQSTPENPFFKGEMTFINTPPNAQLNTQTNVPDFDVGLQGS